MKTFEEWCDEYDYFDTFIGINRIKYKEIAQMAWNARECDFVLAFNGYEDSGGRKASKILKQVREKDKQS